MVGRRLEFHVVEIYLEHPPFALASQRSKNKRVKSNPALVFALITIMKYSFTTLALVAEAVIAFPFVSHMPGVDSSLFAVKRQQAGGDQPGGEVSW